MLAPSAACLATDIGIVFARRCVSRQLRLEVFSRLLLLPYRSAQADVEVGLVGGPAREWLVFGFRVTRDPFSVASCRRLLERIAKRLFAKRSNRTANQISQQREEKRRGLCLLPCAPPTTGCFRPGCV